MDRPIRSCWRGRTTGGAAPPRRSETTTPCAPATRPPRATTPPITDSSRAPSSALKELNCARRCRPIRPAVLHYRMKSCARPTCSMRSASANWWSVSRSISRKTAATRRRWPPLASWLPAAKIRGRCWNSERRRSPVATRSIHTPSPPSGSRAQPDQTEIERSVIYSVARTESAFDQRDKSSANAVGLMQVTPEAARDTAKRLASPTIGTVWSPTPSTIRKSARPNSARC